MKKAILAIATLAILTVGNSFAQQGYSSRGHQSPAVSNARIDNKLEEYSINQLDNIVKLSRKQENEIKKIENYYDRVAYNNRRPQSNQNANRLEVQKQQDILNVLTPNQRQKLMAFQRSDKFDNRGRFDNNSKYNNRKG